MTKSSAKQLMLGLAWLGVAILPLPAQPQPSPWEFYERFVAVDATCAWPSLSVLPDGRLAAVIWPRTNHGVTEGAAECWVSDDHGATWARAGVPVPHVPGTNRMNVASGAVDGKLIALVGGWDRRQPWTGSVSGVGPDKREGAVTINPIPAISTDGGATWTQFPEMSFTKRPDGKSLVPYGRIARLADGEIGVFLYGHGVYFYTSADGGATWTRRGTLTAEERTHNETTWVQLENGDLFAAARTFGDIRLDGYRSRDGGRTWTFEGRLTQARQHPADLCRLPDGRVLLSYGSRNRGLYGIWVQVGDPELNNWSAPVLLVDLEGSTESQLTPVPASDGGYPATVLAQDGRFVTVYYSRGIPAHQRYHMGVVRWSIRSDGMPVLIGPK